MNHEDTKELFQNSVIGRGGRAVSPRVLRRKDEKRGSQRFAKEKIKDSMRRGERSREPGRMCQIKSRLLQISHPPVLLVRLLHRPAHRHHLVRLFHPVHHHRQVHQ